MPIDFYHIPLSAPCRAVLLTARQLGVELNMKHIDLLKGEQLTPHFLSINPEHTVPTIVDGDFTLWESRAICGYLVSHYCNGDWLYPEEAKQRARVDRVLMFDMGTLFHRLNAYILPVLFQGQKPDPKALKSLQEALMWLDNFLDGCTYSAANTITVADHCLAATVETIKQSKISIARYQNIKTWLQRCKDNMPGYEENEEGAKFIGQLVAQQFAAAAAAQDQRRHVI